MELLLGDVLPAVGLLETSESPLSHVTTGIRISQVAQRIGQERFAREIKANFGGCCCFPECEISGNSFLVAGHIDRWSDRPCRRGDIANGLCLCSLHDKAFELGLFTVTAEYLVHINDAKCNEYRWAPEYFKGVHGLEIRASKIRPAKAALAAHWRRHNIKF